MILKKYKTQEGMTYITDWGSFVVIRGVITIPAVSNKPVEDILKDICEVTGIPLEDKLKRIRGKKG